MTSWMIGAFFAAGLIGTIAGLGLVVAAVTSRRWPTVEGTVMKSAYEERAHPGDDCTFYVAQVSYDYIVSGQAFSGSEISARGVDTRLEDVRKILSKYPVGTRVTVYYNPSKPSEALLEPGFDVSSFAPLAIGIIFMVIAVAMFFRNRS